MLTRPGCPFQQAVPMWIRLSSAQPFQRIWAGSPGGRKATRAVVNSTAFEGKVMLAQHPPHNPTLGQLTSVKKPVPQAS